MLRDEKWNGVEGGRATRYGEETTPLSHVTCLCARTAFARFDGELAYYHGIVTGYHWSQVSWGIVSNAVSPNWSTNSFADLSLPSSTAVMKSVMPTIDPSHLLLTFVFDVGPGQGRLRSGWLIILYEKSLTQQRISLCQRAFSVPSALLSRYWQIHNTRLRYTASIVHVLYCSGGASEPNGHILYTLLW